jgi:hypothetical protein
MLTADLQDFVTGHCTHGPLTDRVGLDSSRQISSRRRSCRTSRRRVFVLNCGEEVGIAHRADHHMPILHVIDGVDTGVGGPVSGVAAERAAAWCRYLEAHARRLYATVSDRVRVGHVELPALAHAGDVLH